MPEFSRIIGGAGTGKTTEIMRLMTLILERGLYDPYQIGFVTFTRAARAEAAERAADITGQKQAHLEQAGWFRTIHSIAYMQTGVGDGLLSDDAKSKEWISETISGEEFRKLNNDDGSDPFAEKTDAERALAIWDASRNRMEPFEVTWSRCDDVDDRTPDADYCRHVIELYEQGKRLDGRHDFTDILGAFSGWQFVIDGPRACTPRGDIPEVPVWFCDEQQDSSRLQNEAIRRLTSNSRWVYICGDVFQSIYGFSGSDPRMMMQWDVGDRQRILPQSYRCPAAIQSLGEEILSECSDYWDRNIKPAEHAGEIDVIDYVSSEWLDELNPNHSTLLIARTNFIASRLAKRLNANCIPWRPTSGVGGWHAPKRNIACGALMALQEGSPIDAAEWKEVLKYLPTKERLARGVKTQWMNRKDELEELNNLDGLHSWGAETKLVDEIRSGRWEELIDKADQYVEARKRWGFEAVHDPQIRVGTIHSVKGQEADTVYLMTTTSGQVARAEESDEGFDEERRVAYVAVTRARRRLVVLEENADYRMDIPA